MAISSCGFFEPGENLMGDYRYDISVPEAQELTPFVICMPGHVPSGLDEVPVVDYEKDTGEPIPLVRFRYYYSDMAEEDQRTPALEVDLKPLRSEVNWDDWVDWSSGGGYKLVAWIVTGSPLRSNALEYELETIRLNSVLRRATVRKAEVKGTSGQDYLVYEVEKPEKYESVMVEWIQGVIWYRVYSQLSREETIRVAESLPYCGVNPEPTITPSPRPSD
jgi:hypothetical protein